MTVLENNILEALRRLRGEADGIEAAPEFQNDDFFLGRVEALRDAADVIEKAMASDEPILMDAY